MIWLCQPSGSLQYFWMKTSFLNELTEYNIASRSYEDVLMLLYYSQLGQIPRNDKRKDFQWNCTGQHVLVQLPVQRRVRSQNQPLRILNHTHAFFWLPRKLSVNLGSMTYRNCNVLMLPREDGIEPLSAFFWSFSSWRLIRLPKDVGIAPVSLFSYNLLQNISAISRSANR